MSRHRGTCRACGASMLWTVTPAGKRQPLDPEPDPEKGNRVVVSRGPEKPPLSIAVTAFVDGSGLTRDRVQAEMAYVPHHATCPEAARFRKR